MSIDSYLLTQLEEFTLESRKSRSEVMNKAIEMYLRVMFGSISEKKQVLSQIQIQMRRLGYIIDFPIDETPLLTKTEVTKLKEMQG
jgi:hypothetical protein